MAVITIYNNFKEQSMKKQLDLVNDTVKVMLCTSAYTPNIDTHAHKSDVTNEVTGTGYTAGGKALTAKAVTQDDVDNEGVWDAADLTWATSTITARYGVIYQDTGTAATSILIGYIDFVTDQLSSADDFTLTWGAEGILNFT